MIASHAGGYIADARIRLIEWLPWVLAVLSYFVAPTYLPLGSYVLTMIIFALSLDLILGYGGIITLGHSAYFGAGAYAAGIFAARITGEPLLGLLAGTLAAGLLGRRA